MLDTASSAVYWPVTRTGFAVLTVDSPVPVRGPQLGRFVGTGTNSIRSFRVAIDRSRRRFIPSDSEPYYSTTTRDMVVNRRPGWELCHGSSKDEKTVLKRVTRHGETANCVRYVATRARKCSLETLSYTSILANIRVSILGCFGLEEVHPDHSGCCHGRAALRPMSCRNLFLFSSFRVKTRDFGGALILVPLSTR